jgi:hypothetical protein
MKQQVEITLKLSLWLDAVVLREEIGKLAEVRLTEAFDPEVAPILNPIRIIRIREEADIYGSGSPTLPTRFDAYEIAPCQRFREEGEGDRFYYEPCEPEEADVWTLYGHIPGQGAEAIGDFTSCELAEEVYARITGERYGR